MCLCKEKPLLDHEFQASLEAKPWGSQIWSYHELLVQCQLKKKKKNPKQKETVMLTYIYCIIRINPGTWDKISLYIPMSNVLKYKILLIAHLKAGIQQSLHIKEHFQMVRLLNPGNSTAMKMFFSLYYRGRDLVTERLSTTRLLWPICGTRAHLFCTIPDWVNEVV